MTAGIRIPSTTYGMDALSLEGSTRKTIGLVQECNKKSNIQYVAIINRNKTS